MSWQAPGYAHRLDLGGGRTGRAVLAVREETGDLVVIRYLSVESTQFERVQTEITELSTVESEYFVGVREVIHRDEGIALVTDAVNGANLRHILRDTSAGIGAEAALLVYYESLNGMVAAHAGGVTHGDYRPENVIISTDGAVRMIDARAAAWTTREVTLGTGVYLAPERWRGADDLTAGADVYAATITLVEMLVGEPPYWEDSQLLALRYRHEQEEIPADGIPVELRDVVRLGLAKDADHRGEAFALLELVNLSAIAEFGSDWMEVGRAQLVSLVGDRGLAVAGVTAIEETEVVAGELVELDDYYTDQAAVAGAVAVVGVAESAVVAESAAAESVVVESAAAESVVVESAAAEIVVVESAAAESVVVDESAVVGESDGAEFVVATGSVANESVAAEESDDQAVVGAIAAAEVVAAAAEIVELARIEEMAAVESLVGAEEDVLTEEEERAVAEVSEIVVAVEAAAEEAVVGVAAVGGTAIAATDAELDEFDEVVAAEGVVFESVVLESESAAGAFGEGSVAAGLIAEGVSVEAEAAEAEAVAVAQAEAAEAEEEEEAAAVVAAGIVAGLVAAEAAEAAAAAAVAVPPEEIAVGVAAVPPEAVVVGMASVPPDQVAVGVAPVPPFHRRHPWVTGIAAILLIILCAGGTLAWTGHFPGSPGSQPTPIAALTETPTQGDVVPPATDTPTPSPSDTSNGGVPVTSPSASSTPSGPSASPSSTGGTSTSTTKPSKSKHPKPSPSISKLPVTGAKTTGLFGGAAVLILLGGGLLILGRRRRG